MRQGSEVQVSCGQGFEEEEAALSFGEWSLTGWGRCGVPRKNHAHGSQGRPAGQRSLLLHPHSAAGGDHGVQANWTREVGRRRELRRWSQGHAAWGWCQEGGEDRRGCTWLHARINPDKTERPGSLASVFPAAKLGNLGYFKIKSI